MADEFISEQHSCSCRPPPAHHHIDGSWFLVRTDIAGQCDQMCAGLGCDQLCRLFACNGHHVHAHCVLGVKLEPYKDACSRNRTGDPRQFSMRGGTLRGGSYLILVRMYIVNNGACVDHASRSK